ncbi:MAG: nuclear transport factor 2 family protein [Solirubrobacteraceae bacterium]
MHPFRAAVEAADADAMRDLLADDVVFNSPIAHTTYRGRDVVGGVLAAVVQVFEDFVYESELTGEDPADHGLVFRARVGDKALQGIDLVRTGDDGRITELTVMIRPLSAAVAVRDAMGAMLAKAGVDPKALSGEG